MENVGNSESLFQDEGEVENFKATFGEKLRAALRYNYGICHIQALLGEAITKKSSKTEATLISSVQVALDELDNRSGVSVEMISSFVNDALTDALVDGFGEVEADTKLSAGDMERFGLTLPNDMGDSRDHLRDSRELSAGEELPF